MNKLYKVWNFLKFSIFDLFTIKIFNKQYWFQWINSYSTTSLPLQYITLVSYNFSIIFIVFGGIALILGNILLGPAAIICGFVATKVESPDKARLLRLIGAIIGIVGIIMMVIFWPIMITFIVRWITLQNKWCPKFETGCTLGVLIAE